MGLRAEVHRYQFGPEHLRYLTGEAGNGMWLHCLVTAPVSSAGKSVSLYLSEQDITDLLKVFIERAIAARR